MRTHMASSLDTRASTQGIVECATAFERAVFRDRNSAKGRKPRDDQITLVLVGGTRRGLVEMETEFDDVVPGVVLHLERLLFKDLAFNPTSGSNLKLNSSVAASAPPR
ncbi:hypothetical protein F2Q69_00063112 [Brassica cretica]|uniref:Uncharacterized protein n=1 Tax=Brassica cretica TaxID=69181 RepID=A0A8S9RHB5_BRACR|nr:hypothetical protein F2Q69_00063112 [Brassica cretica]